MKQLLRLFAAVLYCSTMCFQLDGMFCSMSDVSLHMLGVTLGIEILAREVNNLRDKRIRAV